MDPGGGEKQTGTLKAHAILKCFLQTQSSVLLGSAPTAWARPWKCHVLIDPLVSDLSRAHLQWQLCLPVKAFCPLTGNLKGVFIISILHFFFFGNEWFLEISLAKFQYSELIS